METYAQLHAELMELDRQRGRIAYRNGVTDSAIKRATSTAEYRALDEQYKALSARLKTEFPASERRANRRVAREMGF